MAVWEYECKGCGATFTTTNLDEKDWLDVACREGLYHNFDPEPCNGLIKRVWSFAIRTPMPAHFNQSAGVYVSNETQLKDAFKAQSDLLTERTGIEHNLVPIDPADKETLGVTNLGLRETYERRKKLGMPIPKAILPKNLD